MLALSIQRISQIMVAGGDVGVPLGQGLQVDRQGAAVHRLGLGVLPLVPEGRGQVAVAPGGGGVVLAQGLQEDRQCAAVHRLGLGVLPLGREGPGQVLVAEGDVGVPLGQGLQEDGQGAACIASASAYFSWSARVKARLL